jgi:3-methylcrotonyl-CoA carboxylase alpha subunit
MASNMFNKLLIANRGEIAVRVINAAKKLGIKTAAIYAPCDQDALFVAIADETHQLASDSLATRYLDIAQIIQIARTTGADAIHPGYGFLSENANFASACMAANIKFIGPTPAVIAAMGSKANSKQLMAASNIPVIPGYSGTDQSDTVLQTEASKIGYPLLIKASFGGGGKGMRVVTKSAEFLPALHACQREAQTSFGDNTVILEKYITEPRHIEVQVFGDNFGNIVHLFERDCSIQRRHQKIIEESRANISAKTAAKLLDTAVKAAQSLKYTNAGTIDFLMDQQENFYFMEMNTRLQVEHPVTEMLTKIDLVEWQLLVAAGHKLPLQQAQITATGHAIEARICAEDPLNNFLPTSGKLQLLLTPNLDTTTRLDCGITNNSTVGINYDSMLAKLIVAADTREMAIGKLRSALNSTHFIGVKNNIAFLREICANPTFIAGKVSTKYLETFTYQQSITPETAGTITAAVYFVLQNSANDAKYNNNLKNWRLNSNPSRIITLLLKQELVTSKVTIKNADGSNNSNSLEIISYGNNSNHTTRVATYNIHGHHNCDITLNNHLYQVRLHQFDHLIYSSINNTEFYFNLPTTDLYASQLLLDAGSLTAPMHGKVTKILVNPGESVAKAAPLLIIEAMKMEHTIVAPASGVVKTLNYTIGALVEEGAVLLDLASH